MSGVWRRISAPSTGWRFMITNSVSVSLSGLFNTSIGVDVTFEELQRDFDSVAITAGAMNAVELDVPGADLSGVQYGVDFMKRANLGQPIEVGNDVVVIGGGYTAMDCSRTSLRHGNTRGWPPEELTA